MSISYAPVKTPYGYVTRKDEGFSTPISSIAYSPAPGEKVISTPYGTTIIRSSRSSGGGSSSKNVLPKTPAADPVVSKETKQEALIVEEKPVSQKIIIETKRDTAEELNERFKAAGVRNAEEFFRRSRAGDIKRTEEGFTIKTTTIKKPEEEKVFVPRRVDKSETAPYFIDGSETFKDLTYKDPISSRTPGGEIRSLQGRETVIKGEDVFKTREYKEPIKIFGISPTALIDPFRKGLYTAGEKFSVWDFELTKKSSYEPLLVIPSIVFSFVKGVTNPVFDTAADPLSIPKGLVAGVKQPDLFLDPAVDLVTYTATGRFGEAAEIAGEFYAYSKVLKGVEKPVKAVLRWVGDVTSSGIPPFRASQFDTSYNFRARTDLLTPDQLIRLGVYDVKLPSIGMETQLSFPKGSFVPVEYFDAFSKKGVPEIQTQLYPKKFEPVPSSVYGSTIDKPMSYFDFLKKATPEQIDFAVKSQGQKYLVSTIEAPAPSSLTPSQVINVFREESIKTPPKPSTQALLTDPWKQRRFTELEKVMNKATPENIIYGEVGVGSNKQFFRVRETTKPQTPLFALDPLTATYSAVYTEGVKAYQWGKTKISELSTTDIFTPTKGTMIVPVTIPEIKSFSDTTIKPEYEFKEDTITYLKSYNVIKPAISPDIKIKPEIDQRLEEDTKMSFAYRYKPKSKQEIFQDQGLEQSSITETVPFIVPKVPRTTYNPFRTTPKTPEPPKTPKPLFLPVPKTKPRQEILSSKGYDVFVKRKGTFKKVSFKPLTRMSALSLGAGVVGRTAAATFKIKPSKFSASPSRTGLIPNLKDFYTRTSPSGNTLYIEKPSRRIKSRGELEEITFKGISSKRFKKRLTG